MCTFLSGVDHKHLGVVHC